MDTTSMAVKLHIEIFNEIQLNLITHFAIKARVGMGPLMALNEESLLDFSHICGTEPELLPLFYEFWVTNSAYYASCRLPRLIYGVWPHI